MTQFRVDEVLRQMVAALLEDLSMVGSPVAIELRNLSSAEIASLRQLSAGDLGANSSSLHASGLIATDLDHMDKLVLPFYHTSDYALLDQMLNAVSQIQDMVTEASKTPWPQCPHHDEPLLIDALAGDLVWRCPSTRSVIARLGHLANML